MPEVIELARQLQAWGITREQLVDLAILVGTDFNAGVKGIGPKKALELVQAYGRIESMPPEIREAVSDFDEVRLIFLEPDVTPGADVEFGTPDRDAIVAFLCGEREFSRDRVAAALDRAFPQRSLF